MRRTRRLPPVPARPRLRVPGRGGRGRGGASSRRDSRARRCGRASCPAPPSSSPRGRGRSAAAHAWRAGRPGRRARRRSGSSPAAEGRLTPCRRGGFRHPASIGRELTSPRPRIVAADSSRLSADQLSAAQRASRSPSKNCCRPARNTSPSSKSMMNFPMFSNTAPAPGTTIRNVCPFWVT
jgi:hypothetical protein